MTDRPPTSVVVGIDDSHASRPAVAAAAAEAAQRELPLRIVHARAWPTYTGEAPILTYPLPPLETGPDARRLVDTASEAARRDHPGLIVSGHVVDGGPGVVLIEESRHAALVVVGSRGNGGLADLLLGSTAMDVAARAACPVLVVRGITDTDGPVVVGIDGRPASATAVGYAFAAALARGVPLRAVHVWHHATNLVTTAESEEEGRRRAQFVLDEWLREWREGFADVSVETVPVHHASAAKALAEESAKAGLLVIGSRMRSPLRSRLLGSTGYTLAHTSRCPVAIVHPRP